MSRSYDYRALIETYVQTKRRDFVHPDFSAYYAALLSAQERLLGVRIAREDLDFSGKVLWSLFENTVRSLLQITTPWDTYLEAELIHRKLEEAGEPGRIVERAGNTIQEAVKTSRAAHYEMLSALYVAIFGKCDRVVTSKDLRKAGLDDSREPVISDYYDHM